LFTPEGGKHIGIFFSLALFTCACLQRALNMVWRFQRLHVPFSLALVCNERLIWFGVFNASVCPSHLRLFATSAYYGLAFSTPPCALLTCACLQRALIMVGRFQRLHVPFSLALVCNERLLWFGVFNASVCPSLTCACLQRALNMVWRFQRLLCALRLCT